MTHWENSSLEGDWSFCSPPRNIYGHLNKKWKLLLYQLSIARHWRILWRISELHFPHKFCWTTFIVFTNVVNNLCANLYHRLEPKLRVPLSSFFLCFGYLQFQQLSLLTIFISGDRASNLIPLFPKTANPWSYINMENFAEKFNYLHKTEGSLKVLFISGRETK